MKIFSVLFVLFLSFGLNAQIINDGGIEGLQLMTKVSDDLSEIKGSPYWTEEFQFGTIHIKDKEPIKAFLRYNVQEEEMEIKIDPDSEDIYTLNHRNVTYVQGNKKIFADKLSTDNGIVSGLVIEHYKGENYRLIEKLNIEISKAVQAKSSYESDKPAQMKVSSNIYLIQNGETAENIRIKHKDIKKLFPSKTAKNYLSDNKIRNIEDLVGLLEHLDK